MGRFIINEVDTCDDKLGSNFTDEMFYSIVWLIEGLSMGVLMLFHCLNFSGGSLLKTRKRTPEDEQLYATIMPQEYHFFTS